MKDYTRFEFDKARAYIRQKRSEGFTYEKLRARHMDEEMIEAVFCIKLDIEVEDWFNLLDLQEKAENETLEMKVVKYKGCK